MKFLFELMAEVVAESVTPESPRALLLVALAGGFGFSCAMTFLLFTWEQPLYEPGWGFGAIICGIIYGSMGAMLSSLHLVREADDRLLAAASMLMNAAAIVLAIVAALR
jgi:hypothetical protein